MKNLINQIKTSKGNVNFYVADTLSDLDTSDKFCKAYVIADKAYYQSNSSGEWSKITTSSGGSGSGGSITVDSVLSTTSTNPVQNRVITNTLIDKENLGIEITQSEYDDLVTAGTLESDVNYYITDSPSVESEMTNLGTYSTNEINTGEVWINNKPIYRKVFYSAISWENNSIIGIVSNVDTVIKLNSIAKVTGFNVYCSDYMNGEDVNLAAFSKDTNQLMVTRGGFFNNSEESHVIIEYTKITD